MTRAKDISKIVTDANFSGTLDVTGTVTTGGSVGISNASPNANTKLDVNGAARIGNSTDGIMIENNTGSFDIANASYIRRNSSSGALEITSGSTTARDMIFNTGTNGAESFRVSSSGNVGIGVVPNSSWSSYWTALQLGATGFVGGFQAGATDVTALGSNVWSDGSYKYIETDEAAMIKLQNGTMIFDVAPSGTANNAISFTTAMTISNAGNVGIGGTPTANLHVYRATGNASLIIETGQDSGSAEPTLYLISYATNANPAIRFGDRVGNNGFIEYENQDDSLRFGANAAERMRIDSSGNLLVGTTDGTPYNNTGNNPGFVVTVTGRIFTAVHNDHHIFNRTSSDGAIIDFRQEGTSEGSISVSGTTVSYNGGHLSRWSQLADNTRDTTIIKGTVMTNLDQMAEWTTDGVTEDNEQLNCMAISSVEGDANVAGVFVNWDNDDDVYTNDMNIAMTGDMVIRIAQGTTVARGDLLISAGDGTAKTQSDDIVRSKTIAKVTSTNVSHTYEDGTYLVPCVLMAC